MLLLIHWLVGRDRGEDDEDAEEGGENSKRTIPRWVGGVCILCARGGCVPDGSRDSAPQDRRECWVSEAMWGSLLIVSLFPVKEETRSWPEREEARRGLGVLRKGAEMGKS